MRTAAEFKGRQAELKSLYQRDPGAAQQTLTARVAVVPQTLTVDILEPARPGPVGLHTGSGGDGTMICPVELFLSGLASCAGITLAAVAHAMGIELHAATVRVEGDADFRGTLAADRQAPVGLTAIRIEFDLQTDAGGDAIGKLIELTQRYCVVHRTLNQAPSIEVTTHHGSPIEA